jgi:hypothetical protein
MVDLTSSSGGADVEAVEGPWSLAGPGAARLALRLMVAALGVGVVGGMVMACLTVLFEPPISPASLVLVIGLSLVLTLMIGWRLATGSNRWLGRVAGVGVLVVAVVQGWSEVGEFFDGFVHNAGVTVLLVVFGAAYGVGPAFVTVVVLLPVLFLLRFSRVRVSLVSAQILVTVVAMVVAAAFTLWIDMSGWGLVWLAGALAGTGAVISSPWCLVGRRV